MAYIALAVALIYLIGGLQTCITPLDHLDNMPDFFLFPISHVSHIAFLLNFDIGSYETRRHFKMAMEKGKTTTCVAKV